VKKESWGILEGRKVGKGKKLSLSSPRKNTNGNENDPNEDTASEKNYQPCISSRIFYCYILAHRNEGSFFKDIYQERGKHDNNATRNKHARHPTESFLRLFLIFHVSHLLNKNRKRCTFSVYAYSQILVPKRSSPSIWSCIPHKCVSPSIGVLLMCSCGI
jgi:hypothetical protein